MEIKLDKEINGLQLSAEIGIDVRDVYIDGEMLVINTDDESKALEAYKKHKATYSPPTFEEKLANAGISLDELRVALGL